MTQISSSAFNTSVPMCFARGRNGDLYGVNGLDRGIRWDGITANVEQLGISAPGLPPTVVSNSTSPSFTVKQIDVITPGQGFTQIPAVTVANPPSGRPTRARAVVKDGRLERIDITDYGDSYGTPPNVTVGSPTGSVAGSGAVLTPAFTAQIDAVAVNFGGSGYTSVPTISVSGGGGTGASLAVGFILDGRIQSVRVLSRGSGYTSAPTISFSGGGGSGASATPLMRFGVTSVAVTNGGSGYAGRLRVSFQQAATDRFSGGAVATALADASGAITSVDVTAAGIYSAAPTATVTTPLELVTAGATAKAVLGPGIEGRFLCAYRYVDDTLPNPIPSSLSPYATLDINSPAGAIDWGSLSAGSEARVSKIELWRTTADQALVFYRVAVLPSNATTFTDTLRDEELTAATRIRSCTAAAATDIVTCTGHGLGDGDEVFFTALTGGTGVTANVTYYARDITATTFKIALARGGNPVDITADMSAGTAHCRAFAALPLVLANGAPNAYRFGPPPQNKSAVVVYQDRAWYAVDAPGRTYAGASDANHAEPNTLYFSEIDEPESVPETNELIVQDNVNGSDRITALMPFGGSLLVFQERHCYRLAYGAEPLLDGSITILTQRGCLHQRSWDAHDSVAYVADYSGIYSIEGQQVTPLTDAIDNFWADGLFKWSAVTSFFLRIDPRTRIVRFFFVPSGSASNLPDRALCYHPLTQVWWLEQYAQPVTAASVVRSGSLLRILAGVSSGSLLALDSGGEDVKSDGGAQGIECRFRTGSMALNPSKDRAIRMLYKPTSAAAPLSLGLHYNNSVTARPSAISADDGQGFRSSAGGAATLDMASGRSALGSSTGVAICRYAGRLDDRSSGADRHIALDLTATAPATDRVTLYGLGVTGTGE
jgi:hypothetical protein